MGEGAPEDRDLSRTALQDRRRTTLRYYALCACVDARFGRVLRKLEEMGETENTFVTFCSDHVEMLGDRYSKYCLYEASVRVHMILVGAGVPDELHGTTVTQSLMMCCRHSSRSLAKRCHQNIPA